MVKKHIVIGIEVTCPKCYEKIMLKIPYLQIREAAVQIKRGKR